MFVSNVADIECSGIVWGANHMLRFLHQQNIVIFWLL